VEEQHVRATLLALGADDGAGAPGAGSGVVGPDAHARAGRRRDRGRGGAEEVAERVGVAARGERDEVAAPLFVVFDA
jgi:hypothetical protein